MPHLPDRHHDHDPALIAAFAAGDTTGAEHTRASELVASCTACAGLRDDLVAIAAAVHALPAPRRTRDYRLTAEQAARLRPAGWRRLLAPMAGPRFRLAAPLGTTMATLGVAGLLLAAMPGTMLPASPAGGEAAGDRSMSVTRDNAAAPAAASASAAPSMAAPAPSATGGSELAGEASPLAVEPAQGGPARVQDTSNADGDQGSPPDVGTGPAGVDTMAVRAADETAAIIGGALVLLGMALVVLRWSARRLA